MLEKVCSNGAADVASRYRRGKARVPVSVGQCDVEEVQKVIRKVLYRSRI